MIKFQVAMVSVGSLRDSQRSELYSFSLTVNLLLISPERELPSKVDQFLKLSGLDVIA